MNEVPGTCKASIVGINKLHGDFAVVELIKL